MVRIVLTLIVIVGVTNMAKAKSDMAALVAIQAKIERLMKENVALKAAMVVPRRTPRKAVADSPWTDKVTYIIVGKEKETRKENVDAFKTQAGAWVVRFRDIQETMRAGDQVILPDGAKMRVVKFTSNFNGQRLLTLEPVAAAKPKK